MIFTESLDLIRQDRTQVLKFKFEEKLVKYSIRKAKICESNHADVNHDPVKPLP